jgi:hypothetical protein
LVSASDLLREEKDDSSDVEAFDIELFDIELFDCEKEFTATDGTNTKIKEINIIVKVILPDIISRSLIIYNIVNIK